MKAFKKFRVVNSLTTNEDDDSEETEDQDDTNLEMEVRHCEEDAELSFLLSKHPTLYNFG